MSQINAPSWIAPNSGGTIGSFPSGSPANSPFAFGSSDGVRPAWFGGDANAFGSLSSTFPGSSGDAMSGGGISAILSQLANAVQQYIGKLGGSMFGSPAATTSATGTPTARGAATFQDVSLGSVGDPHLSVSGTAQHADGTTASVTSKFDSMSGHADLFSTRDFGDGFKVGTTVTAGNVNGVTQNASATATMDGGRDSVTMTNAGTVSVTSGGSAVALTAGQSITLAGGEQVSEATNGSVSITESAFGKNLTTTFAQNGGGGVDVTAQGHNVTLGGDLVTGGTTPLARSPI
jgi:hypothetical protein